MTHATPTRIKARAIAAPALAAALLLAGCGMGSPSEVISPTAPAGQEQTEAPEVIDTAEAPESAGEEEQAGTQGEDLAPSDTDSGSATGAVSPQDAAQIAIAQYPGGQIVEIELDRSHGVTVWEIDVITADAKYEVKINVSTGEIVKDHRDETRDLGRYHRYLDAATLTYADAIEVARGEHSGATLVGMELDEEHGVLVWEISVMTPDHVEYEMEIDAATGKILKNERDD